MILAGEIGATRTRLAAFETEGNRLNRAVEKNYMSQEHSGLSEIIDYFIKTEGILVNRACFGVAGPVRRGRSKISNLPWIIDSRDLARACSLAAGASWERSPTGTPECSLAGEGSGRVVPQSLPARHEACEENRNRRAVLPLPQLSGRGQIPNPRS